MLITACVQPGIELKPMSLTALSRHVNDCRTMAVSLSPDEAARMVKLGMPSTKGKLHAFVGGAAPVSADGYFITACHVAQAKEGNQLVLMYLGPKGKRVGIARIVWADRARDLALVKAAFATPEYYRWTPRNRDLPVNTPIMHAGMSTGGKGELGFLSERVSGRGQTSFRHTLHLQPGDSGGPVLLVSGELVGVNSAIGFFNALDTSFFDTAQSSRPDPAFIQRLIAKDSRQP